MFQTFTTQEALFAVAAQDKQTGGEKGATLNRYPIRFVLFDNFKDCYDFVDKLVDTFGLRMQSIEDWFDPEYPDIVVTHSTLADKIKEYVNGAEADSIISPFSELARFYDDDPGIEFRTLISTIKSIQSSAKAWEDHRRIYIPIVGLVAKMSLFEDDSQSNIWYLKSQTPGNNYNLVLTNGTTFGIKDIEKMYTRVDTVFDWLKIWRKRDITQKIFCTSKSIFTFEHNARPDNAFEFTPCKHVHDLLTKGLGLDVNFTEYKEQDNDYWLRFAGEIDIDDFNLNAFFNKRFGIHELQNYAVFYALWFRLTDPYERWLLSKYYTYKFCNQGYTCQTLLKCWDTNSSTFLVNLLDVIFEIDKPEEYLEERRYALREAARHNVMLPENMGEMLVERIEDVALHHGYITALKYVSTVTSEERNLLIRWLGDGRITPDLAADIFPDLSAYLGKTFGTQDPAQKWCLAYIDAYKKAKLANQYHPAVKAVIDERNAGEIAFNKWYSDFKTVRTILSTREDIDVYFWIDGLGLEWISFIAQLLKERGHDGFYLNEIVIAKSLLPTATENNKQDLLKLTGGTLSKNGDLDSISHKARQYPHYITSDLELVRNCINKILDDNPHKKIAIVSDHGISYMPQLCSGMNLSGIKGEHSGRFAIWTNGTTVGDVKYKILDDGKTICALTHDSLTSKVDSGAGCHGGCTPEEVLVPIFIISDQKQASSYSASLVSTAISAASPVLTFNVKGIQNIDDAYILYNGSRYEINVVAEGQYSSEPLRLVSTCSSVTLCIGFWQKEYHFTATYGAEEEDLF